MLARARTVRVLSEESLQVAPRTVEPCLTVESGERILLTERKRPELPDGVDAIIRLQDNGRYAWVSHRVLVEAEADVASNGLASRARRAAESWRDAFSYRAQQTDSDGVPLEGAGGLRPPQLGALFAVAAHWTLQESAATIIMPTGTGKTETMLSVLVAQRFMPMVVAVPGKQLRFQTAEKFRSLGLLQALQVLKVDVHYPVVAELKKQPSSTEDLQIFEDCNVVVGVVASLAGGLAETLAREIADRCQVLVVDEAHHVAAKTWQAIKDGFAKRRILQFTATPYREDGQLVDGAIIFSYSLEQAQRDRYFKPIKFVPVHELSVASVDDAIAAQAIDTLKADIAAGFDHLMMARCRTIDRAEEVLKVYERLGPEFSPQLIHSELRDNATRIVKLVSGECRVAVCVGMLGEGFDLPRLKIAALHDPHRSLAPTLQFTGRFTRTSRDKIGEATVIANIADPGVPAALERLYSEDSDWNLLLSEMSSNAAMEHAQLIEFMRGSAVIGEPGDDVPAVAHQLLRPVYSTLTYGCESFTPKAFFKAIDDAGSVVRVWLNEKSSTLFFVTRSVEKVKWTRSKEVANVTWDLHVLHFDEVSKLLYVASSDKSSMFTELAQAVGATEQVSGEQVFRALGRIGRLTFNGLGVSKHGRKNLSYAMYTGADVRNALSLAEKAGSRKANLNGNGWENGKQITIGCSYKGRVWSRDGGTIPQFIEWARHVGAKLVDATINTADIIDNVLIPEEVTSLPSVGVLAIEWPAELLRYAEDRVVIATDDQEAPIFACDLVVTDVDYHSSAIDFDVIDSDNVVLGEFTMRLDAKAGYVIDLRSEHPVLLKVGRREAALAGYFASYPPLIRLLDLSELDGNLLLKPQNPIDLKLSDASIDVWDWTGVDVAKESMWKDGAIREDSIQYAMADRFLKAGFDIVFDDDAPGEAADLVCIKEESDYVRLALVHCKFSGGSVSGARVEDVVEVSSQAVRSAKWAGRFKELCKHILARNERRKGPLRASYFLRGDGVACNRISRAARFKPVRPEILLVQPGLSRAGMTGDQRIVLAAAATYLKQTVGIEIGVVCSA